MEGWIKLHRKILESAVATDNDAFRLWVTLLLKATHGEREYLSQNTIIRLQPGEFITSRKTLAAECNISESKCERLLRALKTGQQLDSKTNSKYRIIKIINWHTYQGLMVDERTTESVETEQQLDSNWTATEQQLNTYKNVNNVKKEKNVKKEEVNAHASEEHKRKPKLDPALTKLKFADNVLLTQTEYDLLGQELGESGRSRVIEILDDYKGASGKRYKSDYKAIRVWCMEKYRQEKDRATGAKCGGLSKTEIARQNNLDLCKKHSAEDFIMEDIIV